MCGDAGRHKSGNGDPRHSGGQHIGIIGRQSEQLRLQIAAQRERSRQSDGKPQSNIRQRLPHDQTNNILPLCAERQP